MLKKCLFLLSAILILALVFPVLPSYADECEKMTIYCPPPVPTNDLLSIHPVCTDQEGKKKWLIQNTSTADITVTWQVYQTAQNGSLTIPGKGVGEYGQASLYTDAVEGENILVIESDAERHARESSAEECIPPPEDAIDVVPVCSDEAGKRKWIFRNTHDQPIKLKWQILDSDQQGELEVPSKPAGAAYAEVILYSDELVGSNILVYYDGYSIKGELEGTDKECLPPPSHDDDGGTDDHDDGDQPSSDGGTDDDGSDDTAKPSDQEIDHQDGSKDEEVDQNNEAEQEEHMAEEEITEADEEVVTEEEEAVDDEPVRLEHDHESLPIFTAEGGKLPKTASPWYTLFFFSLVVMLCSGTWLWWQRKQQT